MMWNAHRTNQTHEHERLTDAALVWAQARSTLRGTRHATELGMGQYAPDLIVLGAFSGSYALARYGLDDYRTLAWVFESKATRADFFRHFKPGAPDQSRMVPLGDFHWVVTPKGLVERAEVPDPWGLLERRGPGLRQVKAPTRTPRTEEQVNELAAAILWTRETFHRQGDRQRRALASVRQELREALEVLFATT
jgi:hypothetical protein